MSVDFLNTSIKLFEFYKSLGEKAMAQVEDDKLFWQPNEENNSIAIIVNHLWGNMLSRWTNFLTTDGEKEGRNRDTEFETSIIPRTVLMERWNDGWSCLFQTMHALKTSDLEQMIYIRNQGQLAFDAIARQLTHYAYHVGQIVLLAKQLAHKPWQTLSIARGESETYNSEKFAHGNNSQHFTDEFTQKQ